MKVAITEQAGQVSVTKVFKGTAEEIKGALISFGYFSSATGEKATPENFKCSCKPINQPHKGKLFAEDGTELTVEYSNGVTYAEAAEKALRPSTEFYEGKVKSFKVVSCNCCGAMFSAFHPKENKEHYEEAV